MAVDGAEELLGWARMRSAQEAAKNDWEDMLSGESKEDADERRWMMKVATSNDGEKEPEKKKAASSGGAFFQREQGEDSGLGG